MVFVYFFLFTFFRVGQSWRSLHEARIALRGAGLAGLRVCCGGQLRMDRRGRCCGRGVHSREAVALCRSERVGGRPNERAGACVCVRVGTDPSFRAARVLITQNLGHLLVHADHRSLRPPPPRPAVSHGLWSPARLRTHSFLLANAAAPLNASRVARCSSPPR